MSILWLSVFLFSVAWLPLIGIYYPTTIHYSTPYWFIFASLSIGILINIFSFRKITFERIDKKYYFFFIPLCFSIYVLPFPYNLASIVLLLGLAITVFHRWGKIFKSMSTGFISSGLILAAQTMIIPFFFILFSRYHRADWLTPVILTLSKAIGLESSIANNELFIRSADKVYSFITSWDIMALYPLLNIFIGGLIAIFLFSGRSVTNSSKQQKIKQILILVMILFFYMIIRYVGMILTFLNITQAKIFWKLDVNVISLIPLIFLLPAFIKFTDINSLKLPPIHLNRRTLLMAISVFIFTFSIIGILGFHDPGTRKDGKILIDEGHSDWEWTTKKFDTEWYGQQSTYNYYCLADYLNHFYHVEQKSESLTVNLLKDYDILMIKTPTEPFSSNEISAIKDFVKQGGGLFIIGDHTNVFGITTNLNPIAEQFGLRFRYDGQYDVSGELSVYKRPKILPHPVVQYMPPFLFASGCMMEAPLNADNVIVGYGIKSLYLDYSRKDFFPENAGNKETMEFGLFLQAAGVKYGKGRVLGFTDSTVWSNFFMFIPGKPELLLGCFQWLNRKNSIFGISTYIFLLLTFFSLLTSIYLFIKFKTMSYSPVTVFVLIFTIPISVLIMERMNKINYPVPEPHTRFVQVNFEYDHSEYELPNLHITRSREQSLATFYVTLQRLGHVPKVQFSFQEALNNGDALVIANPDKSFSPEEIEYFYNYLKEGGKALILTDGHQAGINQLLKPVDMSVLPIMRTNTAKIYREDKEDTVTVNARNIGMVHGGEAILYADLFPSKFRQPDYSHYRQEVHIPQSDFPDPIYQPGEETRKMRPYFQQPNISQTQIAEAPIDVKKPVFATKTVGKGMIAVMACFDIFNNVNMGYSSSIPGDNMRKIYELEYWIFRDLFDLGSR